VFSSQTSFNETLRGPDGSAKYVTASFTARPRVEGEGKVRSPPEIAHFGKELGRLGCGDEMPTVLELGHVHDAFGSRA
jgi:hypothetical protein